MIYTSEQGDCISNIVLNLGDQYSNGQIENIEHLMINSQTNYGPNDPNDLFIFAFFDKGKISHLTTEYRYSDICDKPREKYPNLLKIIKPKKFSLTAEPYTEKTTKKEMLDYWMGEKKAIEVKAPLKFGKPEVSLPAEADWLDIALLTNQLEKIGLICEQKEYFSIKSKKKKTKIEDLLHVQDYFSQNNFTTNLNIGSRLRQDVSFKYIPGEISSCGFTLRGYLLGLSEKEIRRFQNHFEQELGINITGRRFEVHKMCSKTKNNKLRIEYE
jgi:hypothetical protein